MNETPAVTLDAEDKEMLNNLPSSNRRLSSDGAPSWSLMRENTRLACPVQEIPRRRRRESRIFGQQQPKPKEEDDDDDEAARARKQADAREFDRDVASGLITVHRGRRRPESFSFEILLAGRSASDTFNTRSRLARKNASPDFFVKKRVPIFCRTVH